MEGSGGVVVFSFKEMLKKLLSLVMIASIGFTLMASYVQACSYVVIPTFFIRTAGQDGEAVSCRFIYETERYDFSADETTVFVAEIADTGVYFDGEEMDESLCQDAFLSLTLQVSATDFEEMFNDIRLFGTRTYLSKDFIQDYDNFLRQVEAIEQAECVCEKYIVEEEYQDWIYLRAADRCGIGNLCEPLNRDGCLDRERVSLVDLLDGGDQSYSTAASQVLNILLPVGIFVGIVFISVGTTLVLVNKRRNSIKPNK